MIAHIALPAGLAFIMLAIGLTLQLSDFTRVFHRPRIIALGLFCQIILLPLTAFGLLTVWPVDPVLAAGIMILAACPGGITSNLLTHFARGDTALSISLTAISSAAGVMTIPLAITAFSHFFPGLPAAVHIPLGPMIAGIFAVSSLPVLAGMTINHLAPVAAEKISTIARPLSVAVFALIVIGAFAAQWTAMMTYLPKTGPVMLALNLVIMVTGYTLAVFTGAGKPSARAIALEGGLQNGALGIFVATTIAGNSTLAVPSITYALIMNLTAAIFIAAIVLTRAPAQA